MLGVQCTYTYVQGDIHVQSTGFNTPGDCHLTEVLGHCCILYKGKRNPLIPHPPLPMLQINFSFALCVCYFVG